MLIVAQNKVLSHIRYDIIIKLYIISFLYIIFFIPVRVQTFVDLWTCTPFDGIPRTLQKKLYDSRASLWIPSLFIESQ